MATADWTNGGAIVEQIRATSARRRSEPLIFFRQFLRDIWMDNTESEAVEQWATKVEQFPWYADDALSCIDAIVANPPGDLVELMQEHGWIMLDQDDIPAQGETATGEVYLTWLKQMRDRFRAIYDAAPASVGED